MKLFTNGTGICMGKVSNDFVCDLNCPDKKFGCCRNCKESRKSFRTIANKHLWTKEKGFWSKTGCKLPREKMPPECKSYDCRHHAFNIVRIWCNREWIDGAAVEINNYTQSNGKWIENNS